MALDRLYSLCACVRSVSGGSRSESHRAPVFRSRLRVSPREGPRARLFRCVAYPLLRLARVSAQQIFRMATVSVMSFPATTFCAVAIPMHLTNR